MWLQLKTVIEKAKITPWAGLTAEEKQLFTDYFITSSQNLDKIPSSFAQESTFATALKDVLAAKTLINGLLYTLTNGVWTGQAPVTVGQAIGQAAFAKADGASATNMKVGDVWKISITGAKPNAEVTVGTEQVLPNGQKKSASAF